MYDIAPMAEKFAYDYLKNNKLDPDVVHRLPFKTRPPYVAFRTETLTDASLRTRPKNKRGHAKARVNSLRSPC